MPKPKVVEMYMFTMEEIIALVMPASVLSGYAKGVMSVAKHQVPLTDNAIEELSKKSEEVYASVMKMLDGLDSRKTEVELAHYEDIKRATK